MDGKMLSAAVAAFAAAQLAAVTVGPEWCVAYPESGSKDVNRALKVAAEEVRDDINEATGLKLKAVPASRVKPPAIYIGAESAKSAGFDLSNLKWYDNVIAEKGGSIYLFGNDRPGRDAAKFKDRIAWFRCILPSVKAATRFLETAVGVRFLMPGKVGTEIPKRKDVSLADGSMSKERPPLIYGNGRSGDDGMIYRIANGFWGMGAFHTYGGHTYPDACPGEKYFKDHPEYFSLRDGKRMLGPTPGQTPLCISNPDVEELIVAELKRQFDMGAAVCQLGQHDGCKVCECDKCRAMYGTGDDWGEKIWRFHRHIAERMLKERPGKIVNIMSYADTFAPPKTFKVFPANVMIEMCRYGEEDFRKWKEYTVPHGFVVYSYLCGNYVMPGFVARHSFAYYARLAKRFHDNGVRGVYRCGAEAGDLFGTEGPGYYVFNRLLQDGSLNVKTLVADYYQAAFGPASEQMKRFYVVQDSRLRMFDRIAEDFTSDAAAGLERYQYAMPKNPLDLHGWMFSPDTTAGMEAALSRAEKTKGLSTKQRKRLELVRLEFDYAKNMGAISTLYSSYRLCRSKESITPLLKAIQTRNAYLDRLFDGNSLPKRLDGWPEVQPFGGESSRNYMSVNGRLSALIKIPLTWDADRMLKYRIVPDERMTPEERSEELKQAGIRPLTGFAMNRADAKRPGAMFEPYPDGTGFRFGQGSNRHVRVTARIGGRQGLMPGRTYRLSWLTRWENVNATCSWNGYYFSAEYDVWDQKTRPQVQVPNDRPLHSGSSKGWMRESVVMKVCDKPGFVSECTFRFWGCTDGVAEVRDIALEEVEDLGNCNQKTIFRGI